MKTNEKAVGKVANILQYPEGKPPSILNATSLMSNNSNVMEQHGCIVCGRVYNLLVVYDPDGRLVDCTVTSPGGLRVMDAHWPLVACDRHTQAEIETAVANHYPGKAIEDLEDD